MSTLRVDNIKSRTGTVLTVPDSNTLAVTGIVSVTSGGSITNAGTLTNTGDLNLGGNAIVTGSLDVTGATSFNNPSGIITTGTLNVGTLSQQNGTFTGTVTAAAFSGPLTGNVTGNCSGTAGSTGVLSAGATGADLTLSGNLTVNGTTTTIDTAVTAVDSLDIDGNISVGGTATFKGVTETVNTGAYSGTELTCDTATGTVFTHDLQAGLVNSIKISNFPATSNSFQTVTIILTQNNAGTAHTTPETGLGLNVTLDPIGVTPFSKAVKVGSGTTITLGATADDMNIITLGVHYNGGTNTDAANYNVFITKNGDFR